MSRRVISFVSMQNMLDISWLIFLIVLFIYFWRARQITRETRLWFKTQGRITQCELTTYEHSVWPKIEYVYKVDNQEFKSEAMFLDITHINFHSAHARAVAYRVVNAYKQNDTIDVYYNPDSPGQAVLDITIPWKLNLILSLIGGLLVLHVGVVIYRFL